MRTPWLLALYIPAIAAQAQTRPPNAGYKFAPKAPLPNSAKSKISVINGPEKSGGTTAQDTAISRYPLRVFEEHVKSPPASFKFPSPLKRLQFNSKILRLDQGQSSQPKKRLRWKIPQANQEQPKVSQVTAVGKILQWNLPELNKGLSKGFHLIGDNKRARLKFKQANKVLSQNTIPNKIPQWRIPEALKGLQMRPLVTEAGQNKTPTKKVRPKIPQAVGITLKPTTGSNIVRMRTSETIKGLPVTIKGQSASSVGPGASNGPPVNVKIPTASTKSKVLLAKKRPPLRSKVPAHQNAVKTPAPKAFTPFMLRNAPSVPILRQREANERSINETKKLVMKMMEQAVYSTQSDRLPIVNAVANRHAQDTRFRMAFIFLKLDEMKHEMHTMYSYLKKNLDTYQTVKGSWFDYFRQYRDTIPNRLQLLYYTHFVRKNVDITYSIEYLLELCKSTDEQAERLRQLQSGTQPQPSAPEKKKKSKKSKD